MSNLAGLEASGIFVDLENMAIAADRRGVRFDLTRITARVGEVGVPLLRKAYGDWGRFAKYQNDFVKQAFDLIQLFPITSVKAGTSGKNGLDIQMSVDSMEAIFLWQHISLVFLVTGDGDFCPLVRMLRKHGRRVIGIGWSGCTSRTFREHCDEFWPYEQLAAISATSQISTNGGLARNGRH